MLVANCKCEIILRARIIKTSYCIILLLPRILYGHTVLLVLRDFKIAKKFALKNALPRSLCQILRLPRSLYIKKFVLVLEFAEKFVPKNANCRLKYQPSKIPIAEFYAYCRVKC